MIKDVNGKFDHYSISPKIRQILLHWVYELVGSDLLWLISLTTFVHKNINPYWFNRQELLQKAKDTDIITVVLKEKLLSIILLIKMF